jgi:hypothetical protein
VIQSIVDTLSTVKFDITLCEDIPIGIVQSSNLQRQTMATVVQSENPLFVTEESGEQFKGGYDVPIQVERSSYSDREVVTDMRGGHDSFPRSPYGLRPAVATPEYHLERYGHFETARDVRPQVRPAVLAVRWRDTAGPSQAPWWSHTPMVNSSLSLLPIRHLG